MSLTPEKLNEFFKKIEEEKLRPDPPYTIMSYDERISLMYHLDVEIPRRKAEGRKDEQTYG